MDARDTANVDFVKRYLAAIGEGATGDALRAFFHDDVVQEEFPNRLMPEGARRGIAEILEGAIKGQRVVRNQRFDVRSTLVDGDRVAVEVDWSATLQVPLASTPAGGSLRARFAIFVELRDGRILSQRNYDCFDPF